MSTFLTIIRRQIDEFSTSIDTIYIYLHNFEYLFVLYVKYLVFY